MIDVSFEPSLVPVCLTILAHGALLYACHITSFSFRDSILRKIPFALLPVNIFDWTRFSVTPFVFSHLGHFNLFRQCPVEPSRCSPVISIGAIEH